MSQHDYNLINASGAAFRADLNLNLVAIAENNSGLTEPTTMFAYQWWADTTSGYLKQRNAANNGWIIKSKLASDMLSALQIQEFTAFTSAGTSTAYTLTTVPALAALTTNENFRIKFHTTSGATPTLARDGLTAKLIKQYDSTGAKVTAVIIANQLANVEYDGTDYVILNPLPASYPATEKLPTVGCTQAAGELTFTAASMYLDFRSATLDSGTPTTVLAAPANLVLPSGGTLGFVTTVQGRIVLVEINNAGTAELAIVNIAGGNDLSETGVINTTAIGTGSDSNNVFYSTTARTGVAYRVVCAVDAVNTGGAWGDPILVQGAGGNALTAMGSLGYGQTWQVVTGSRALDTTYYNTTGRPITVHANAYSATTPSSTIITVNGVAVSGSSSTSGYSSRVLAIVPPGGSYVISNNGTSPTGFTCNELR